MSNDEENNTIQDNLEVAGSVLEGFGTSLNSIYASWSSNLERTAKMAEALTIAMEQIYRDSVTVVCNLKPAGNGIVDMKVTIKNNAYFHIMSMTGQVGFEGDDKFDITFQNDTLFKSPCNLSPQSRVEQILCFKMLNNDDFPKRCKGILKISFPHPSTKRLVEIEKTFGIYIIDQLTKKIIDKSNLNKFDKHSYRVGFIREMMEIHPLKGMDIGMCIELSSATNCKVVCEIIGISKDFEMMEIEFSGELNQKGLVNELIKELNRLAE